jgi:integrase/recombinase XerC
MNDQPTSTQALVLSFIRSLAGDNKSAHTATAYQTDVRQFLAFVKENDITVTSASQITREHVVEYLSHLADMGRSGVTRGRKLVAIREFFKYLVNTGTIPHSPAQNISMPRKEKKAKVFLRPDEYARLLSAAGGNPRDFCILQLFLQTGIRVSELVALTLEDIDLAGRTLRVVQGKGKKERTIPLEKKGLQALKSWLALRPQVQDQHVFLSYQGEGFSVRGVMKIVQKYARLAGITKKFSCHSLRHTFATYKALDVSPFLLQDWLGHERMETTRAYVHLAQSTGAHKAMEATSL